MVSQFYTRVGHTPVFAELVKSDMPQTFEVQIGKLDHRPETRHYGYRFRPMISTKRRCKAELIALRERTDRRCVRIVAK